MIIAKELEVKQALNHSHIITSRKRLKLKKIKKIERVNQKISTKTKKMKKHGKYAKNNINNIEKKLNIKYPVKENLNESGLIDKIFELKNNLFPESKKSNEITINNIFNNEEPKINKVEENIISPILNIKYNNQQNNNNNILENRTPSISFDNDIKLDKSYEINNLFEIDNFCSFTPLNREISPLGQQRNSINPSEKYTNYSPVLYPFKSFPPNLNSLLTVPEGGQINNIYQEKNSNNNISAHINFNQNNNNSIQNNIHNSIIRNDNYINNNRFIPTNIDLQYPYGNNNTINNNLNININNNNLGNNFNFNNNLSQYFNFNILGNNRRNYRDISYSRGLKAQNTKFIKENLSKTKIKKVINLEDNRRDCIICLNEFKIGQNIYTLPCSHIFHVRCLNKEIKIRQKCPICRKELKGQLNN